MKKAILPLLITFLCLPLLSSCKKDDYTTQLSDVKSDLFLAETEEFTLSLSCVSRENPFLSDGVASPRSNVVEIVLTEKTKKGAEYEVYVLDGAVWGGEMSFRNVTGDYFYSKGVESFPEKSVSLRVQWEDQTRELCATSVKNEKTLSTEQALAKAVESEKEYIRRNSREGRFCGEFHVRLLRRDKTYYYVGMVNCEGKTLALLLNAETGEILARRECN